jgi:membrane-bound inhibitor of C-type lysozyme
MQAIINKITYKILGAINMNSRLFSTIFFAGSLAMLSACSSIKLNPFSSDSAEQSRNPQNAVEYVCDAKKRFFVRMLNNGNDAWLIYPDHEVNLPKAGDNRYSSGAITLAINGAETTLNDGEKIAYTNCKAQEVKIK